MKFVKNKRTAFLSLILFSFLSFLIWRIEVEYHGWSGLIWLSYFHLAIPICLLMFVIWVNTFFNLGNFHQKIIINSFLLVWIILGSIAIINSLNFIFVSGPSAMLYLMLPKWKMLLMKFIALVVVPLFPLISLLSLRLIKIKIPGRYLVISQLLFLSAFPIAVFLLKITSHVYSTFIIHAVKSGFVFPFLFFSLGLPLIYAKSFTPKVIDDESILDNGF